MDHVCLAVGEGTRLGRLGRYLQKCMYPIGTRPFLEYALINLLNSRHVDVSDDQLVLVVGHLGEQVAAYFSDSFHGLAISYVQQPERLGTGHAVETIAKTVRSDMPAVVWLADLYVPKELFEACAAHPLEHVLTPAPAPATAGSDIRVDVTGGTVTRSWRGSGPFIDIGLWKMAPTTMARMADIRAGEYRFLPNLQALIDEGLDVGAVTTDEWIHLGGTPPTAHDNVLAVVDRLSYGTPHR